MRTLLALVLGVLVFLAAMPYLDTGSLVVLGVLVLSPAVLIGLSGRLQSWRAQHSSLVSMVGAVLLCSLLGYLGFMVIMADDTPTTITQDITGDPDPMVTVNQDTVTILFTFPDPGKVKADSDRFFPSMVCRLKEGGYRQPYHLVGLVAGVPVASVNLSPQEVRCPLDTLDIQFDPMVDK